MHSITIAKPVGNTPVILWNNYSVFAQAVTLTTLLCKNTLTFTSSFRGFYHVLSSGLFNVLPLFLGLFSPLYTALTNITTTNKYIGEL